MRVLLLAASLRALSADFIARDLYAGSSCSGAVFETDQRLASGCTPFQSPTFASYSLACVNESAALIHLFTSADCTGASSATPYADPGSPFGCNATGFAPHSSLVTCKPGDFAPFPNALDVSYFGGPMTCPPAERPGLVASIRMNYCIDEPKGSYKWGCNATYMIEEYWGTQGCSGASEGAMPFFRRGCTPAANASELGLLVQCNGRQADAEGGAEPDWERAQRSQLRLRAAAAPSTAHNAILDAISRAALP